MVMFYLHTNLTVLGELGELRQQELKKKTELKGVEGQISGGILKEINLLDRI